jgi:uncharacterized protein
MSTSPAAPSQAPAAIAMPLEKSELVQIEGVAPMKEWVPSRFNARTLSDDGSLVLYNSYTGAFSAIPAHSREQAEVLLHKNGSRGKREGLVKYLHERGFIVEKGADEFERFRLLYGQMQYRSDKLELILLSSEECNFRCVYCYETFPRGTMEKWVRESIIKMVERRAPRLNGFKVSWFGGEPLLGYEAIEELAPFFKNAVEKHDIAYTSDITTNGYLLTPDKFENLLKWRVTAYQVTIDGAPEDHDQKRILKGGGSTFDQIYENLKAMRSFPGGFHVNIRINFDHDNMGSMGPFMDKLKQDFMADRRFQLRFYPVGKWGGPNDDKLDICGVSALKDTHTLQVEGTQKGLNVESKLEMMQSVNGLGVCYAARPYNLLIGADGKIMKCTIDLDTKDYNIVGHMSPDGRAEIDIEKFNRFVKPYFEDDASCRKCFYLPVCQGCSCPTVRIQQNERPCPPDKLNIASSLKTLWKMKKQIANELSVTSKAG